VPSGQTCWGDRLMPGSDWLINQLSLYISKLPRDPLSSRGWGDAYLYHNGQIVRDCTNNPENYLNGHWILYRPDNDNAPGTSQFNGCNNSFGIFACCGNNAPCGNDGGFYCAVKLD